MKSTKSSSNRVSQKRRTLVPKAMNASMEIWEIQRELKRGEMVQVRSIVTYFRWYVDYNISYSSSTPQ